MVMQLPWVAVGSDGAALNIDAPGVPHARSFGTHARILGHYVREEGVLTLEDAIRKIVLEQVKPHSDEITLDALGNVLVTRQGSQNGKRLRVLLAAHMDEVGFMITSDDGDGIFRFDASGGLDERQLPGKPVVVGNEQIPGVIGAKPIHMTTVSERKNNIDKDSLRIDVVPRD